MNKIKKFREKAGLSQVELAKKMRADQGAVSDWETGRHAPRVDTLKRIAKAIRCQVSDLI